MVKVDNMIVTVKEQYVKLLFCVFTYVYIILKIILIELDRLTSFIFLYKI